MGMLDHWHPVCPVRGLKRKPVAVQLAGRSICLFRTRSGRVAALDDACPHRRLKLSYGRVVGDRIECKYHGWTFDADGVGESPGTPKLNACAGSYDAREDYGHVWIKSRASAPAFPEIRADGYVRVGTLRHVVPAPLELTVDNFTEIEHSGTVHDTFGYDVHRLHEVRVRFEPTNTSVRVVNVGPTKRVNSVFRRLLGVRDGDLFHDEWTTYFSPVYGVYDHWWMSPDGRREGMVRWRLYMFFCPIDAASTAVTTFAFVKSRYPGPGGGVRLTRWLFRWEIDREVRQDVAMLAHLADHNVGIGGMRLGRFDRVLGLTRERIARVYRGETGRRIAVA